MSFSATQTSRPARHLAPLVASAVNAAVLRAGRPEVLPPSRFDVAGARAATFDGDRPRLARGGS